LFGLYPWFSLRSNHGLKLANAFGVFNLSAIGHFKTIANNLTPMPKITLNVFLSTQVDHR